MGRLEGGKAKSQFPRLTERLDMLYITSSTHRAASIFELLRDLREEFFVPELVEEMNRLIQLEPPSA